MKPVARKPRTAVIATLIASALAGCASGGGESNSNLPDVIACLFTAPLGGSGCPTSNTTSGNTSGTGSSDSTVQSPPQFTTWADLQPGQVVDAPAVAVGLGDSRNNGLVSPSSDPSYSNPTWHVTRDFDVYFWNSLQETTTLAASGQPAIHVSTVQTVDPQQSPYTSVPVATVSATANPYELGWNYQTFGVWAIAGVSAGGIGGLSVGSITPGSAIPTTGSATFNGKLAGLYISPAGVGSVASADLKVDADFSARSLNVASTGTMTTRDFATATAASGLNLSGTLTYSAGTNSFSGTLTSANGMSGTSQGRFYGPGAQELGGAFALRSASTVETFVGAYGAKR